MMSATRPVVVESHVEGDVLSDLVRWVSDQVRRQAVRFILLQKGQEQPVDEWLVSEMLDTRSLAVAIHAVGVREAHTLRESLAYWVFSLRGDAPVAASRFPFRVDVGSRWQAVSDSPDERGVTAMLIRHTEHSARLSLGHSRDIVEQYEKLLDQGTNHLSRLLGQAYARIDVLEAREAEAIELRDKLLTVAGDRDIRLEEIKCKNERQKQALQEFAPLGRVFLGKLLGRETASGVGASPGANDPATASVAARLGDDLVDDLIASMTSEQILHMIGVLRPEQTQLFEQIYNLAEARIRRKAGVAAPVPGGSEAAPAPPPSPPPSSPPPPPPPSAPRPTPRAGKRRNEGPPKTPPTEEGPS